LTDEDEDNDDVDDDDDDDDTDYDDDDEDSDESLPPPLPPRINRYKPPVSSVDEHADGLHNGNGVLAGTGNGSLSYKSAVKYDSLGGAVEYATG